MPTNDPLAKRPSSLPPGPPGTILPTLRLLRNPRESFRRWVGKYGDPFLLRALNGPVVVTGNPKLVREAFSHDPMAYEAFAADTLRPLLGSGSMLLLSGQPHRRERKLVMPMFHGDRMRAYADIMRDAACDAIAKTHRDQPFDFLDVSTEISLTVIVKAIFGGDDPTSTERFVELARDQVRKSSPILFFSPRARIPFLGISPWDRFRRSRDRLRDALFQEIERRETSTYPREDILSLLSAATYEDGSKPTAEHIHDELGTFLFAGHETTAIALAWAMYHLHSNPDALATLRAELSASDDAPESIAQLPYLKAVVQETLRLHPIVTEVLRYLKEPFTLGEYHIPPGTSVAMAAAITHYREDVFSNAERFHPERFIDRTYSSSEYFPFGGGHRRCAGAAFASYEMAIALGTLLRQHRFELLESKPVTPKRRNITMGPSTGVKMKRIA